MEDTKFIGRESQGVRGSNLYQNHLKGFYFGDLAVWMFLFSFIKGLESTLKLTDNKNCNTFLYE